METMKNFIHGIIDIIYPKICHACKKKMTALSIDEVICIECWAKIKKNTPPFCHSCGRDMRGKKSLKNTCLNCIKRPLQFDRAFSPCLYEGVIKELIHAFKYQKKDYLGITLAKLMIDFIKEYNLPIQFMDLIIPIPLYKTKLREREFNHAFILSKYLGAEFNKEVSAERLSRNKNTKTQTELKDNERFSNVKGCFSVPQENCVKNRNILLIDDVLTTGATVSEAALALKNAGANIVYVLTLAS